MATAVGSSPLARGLRGSSDENFCEHGIIPARAGFTGTGASGRRLGRDHPRSRGVYDPHPQQVPRSVRIIPARAGFTVRRRGQADQREDHPRSRGVYERVTVPSNTEAGSSPLARGLRAPPSRWGAFRGIIPARAGFTSPAPEDPAGHRDHPRSRGVYHRWTAGSSPGSGSSPLARGLHLRIPGIPTTSHTTRPRLPSLPT